MGIVFFDLDGVVADTEAVRERAHAHVVAQFSGTLPVGATTSLAGRSLEDTGSAVISATGIKCSLSAYLTQFRKELLVHLNRTLPLGEGVIDLIRMIRLANHGVGLVSSSERPVVDLVISDRRLKELFDFSISVDDVLQPKPAADPYSVAQQMVWPLRGPCVVLEDSVPGASAAMAAGLQVIGVASGENATVLKMRGLPVVESLANTSLAFELVTRHMTPSAHLIDKYSAAIRGFAGRKMLVTDARGTILDAELDEAASHETLSALLEVIESGVALAIVAGSSIDTIERYILRPLRQLAAEGHITGMRDILIYTGHAAEGWTCRWDATPTSLDGYSGKILAAADRALLVKALDESPSGWHVRQFWGRPGQVNIHVDHDWRTRRMIASEMSDKLRTLAPSINVHLHVPSAKARIDISLASKDSGLADAQRRFGYLDDETVVVADSLQDGGSDWPMIHGHPGILAIQTGRDAPRGCVVHGPGIGVRGAVGWLKVWAGERADGCTEAGV